MTARRASIGQARAGPNRRARSIRSAATRARQSRQSCSLSSYSTLMITSDHAHQNKPSDALKGTRALKEVTMDKNIIKETMLSLEGASLQSARQKYLDYVADARLDRSEPIESDEQAQGEIASDLSEALDDTLHDHTDKLDKLREVDFGPKSAVTEGALVRLSGRYFVIAVSTGKFTCDGREVMGISTMAPIFEAIEGARAGETVEFNGRKLVIEDVA